MPDRPLFGVVRDPDVHPANSDSNPNVVGTHQKFIARLNRSGSRPLPFRDLSAATASGRVLLPQASARTVERREG